MQFSFGSEPDIDDVSNGSFRHQKGEVKAVCLHEIHEIVSVKEKDFVVKLARMAFFAPFPFSF